MANQKKILKNTTASTITISELGFSILANSSRTLEPGIYYLLAENIDIDGSLATYIRNGSIVVNDGAYDIKPPNFDVERAIDYVKWPDRAWNIRFMSEPERTNGFYTKNVQEAIEENKTNIDGRSRFTISCGFDGNASTGRYLEYQSNVDSNIAGFVLPRNAHLREMSLVHTSNSACTFKIYKWNGVTETEIASINTTSAQRIATVTGLNVALLANSELRVKVTAGSCARPILYKWFIFD